MNQIILMKATHRQIISKGKMHNSICMIFIVCLKRNCIQQFGDYSIWWTYIRVVQGS